MTEYPRDIPMLFSRELLETLFTRDENCNRLKLELGEPGYQGFYTPVISVDYDDNPLKKAEAERDWLLEAGDILFGRYTSLVDSGDAGSWDWREEEECKGWLAASSAASVGP